MPFSGLKKLDLGTSLNCYNSSAHLIIDFHRTNRVRKVMRDPVVPLAQEKRGLDKSVGCAGGENFTACATPLSRECSRRVGQARAR